VLHLFQVEEFIQQHPAVLETLAFSAPHPLLQETIGVAVRTRAGEPRPSLEALHAFLDARLHRSKWSGKKLSTA
jgi:acyl-CoA synthetase (AMP-forming)/AMP-acid ligase II